jgi:signal peptidase I
MSLTIISSSGDISKSNRYSNRSDSNNESIASISWRPKVACVDSSNTTQPKSDPVIDGYTVQIGDRVLFTNLTDTNLNNKIFSATNTTSNVIWSMEFDGPSGDGSPTSGDVVVVENGTLSEKKMSFDGTDWIVEELYNIVEDTTPQLGGTLDINEKYIKLSSTLTSNSTFLGNSITLTVDTNAQGFGAPLVISSDGHLDTADADDVALSPCFGLAGATGTGEKTIILPGSIVRFDTWDWTPGGLVYVGTSVGTLTQTKPAGYGPTQYTQIVGVALTADVLYFMPCLGKEAENIELTRAPLTNQTWSGPWALMQVDVNAQGFGAPLYLASDGNLETADADASTTMPCKFLAGEGGTGANIKIILPGSYVRNDSWNWTTLGGPLYVSTSVGTLTQTKPTGSGDQIQIVGYATHADRIFFYPDPTVIELV